LANVEALLGLAMVATSIALALVLIFRFVGSGLLFSILVGVVIAGFAFLWFALPIDERVSNSGRR
jgi:hypothetical protein